MIQSNSKKQIIYLTFYMYVIKIKIWRYGRIFVAELKTAIGIFIKRKISVCKVSLKSKLFIYRKRNLNYSVA